MSSNLQVLTVLSLMSLLSCCSSGYELQDTIHALKEENLQLQHRLENLTEALRDLKHLLTEHSKVYRGQLDNEYLHTWREWSQHGISAETHQMLEQAFCLPELHNAAHAIFITPTSLLLLVLVFVLLTQLL